MHHIPSILAAVTLAAAAICAPEAGAQTPAVASPPVVVIVQVAKPWYAPRALVVSKMQDSIPQYADLPGLVFKAFTFERESGDFGGVYLWRDRASAEAWFDSAWFERVRRERGVEARVRILQAPLSIDNAPAGTPQTVPGVAVVTVVSVQRPADLTNEGLLAGFNQAVPTYQKVPGLLRKHFTFDDQGQGRFFGGVYLWKDEASAQAWFNAAWHQHVRDSYGQPARIEWFDAPILLPSRNAANRLASGVMIEAAR